MRAKPTLTATVRRARRDAEIRGLYVTGNWTLAKLAKRFGVSDTRVWQIVRRYRKPQPQPVGENDA
jgi:Mor family transcriptional regulator